MQISAGLQMKWTHLDLIILAYDQQKSADFVQKLKIKTEQEEIL